MVMGMRNDTQSGSVDRERRNMLIQAIERYLAEETTAFQFHDEIFAIRDRTADGTVKQIISLLWYFYDDCTDHRVHLTREQWDYFQKLILLLHSDRHIKETHQRMWSWTQAVAGLALAAFIGAVWQTGWGYHLFVIAVPFGLLSIVLAATRGRLLPTPSRWERSLMPFSSLSQLLEVGRVAMTFRRRRYPGHLQFRRIRTPARELRIHLQTYAVWVLFSPLALLAQVFPVKFNWARVEDDQEAGLRLPA
jgi:hypothetical protein